VASDAASPSGTPDGAHPPAEHDGTGLSTASGETSLAASEDAAPSGAFRDAPDARTIADPRTAKDTADAKARIPSDGDTAADGGANPEGDAPRVDAGAIVDETPSHATGTAYDGDASQDGTDSPSEDMTQDDGTAATAAEPDHAHDGDAGIPGSRKPIPYEDWADMTFDPPNPPGVGPALDAASSETPPPPDSPDASDAPSDTPSDDAGHVPSDSPPAAGNDDDAKGETPGKRPVTPYEDWADMTFDPPNPPGVGSASDAAPAETQPSQDSPDASDAPSDTPSDDGGHPPSDSLPAPAAGGSGDDGGTGDAQASDAPVPASPREPATQDAHDADKGNMPLMGHLNELRFRLVRCCIAAGLGFLLCWAFVDPIFDTLTAPLLKVLPANSTAIYTTLPEGFFIRMFIAFIAGLFVASPVIFHQIWSFIAPGLYDEEKRFLVPLAAVSALFFIAGGSFCYFIVFPYAFAFFVSYSTETIVVMPKVSDYLDFVLKLILAFGLIFEMPLFAFFLSRMGLVTADGMRSFRRYAVVGIFIAAAILTPPDVVSQLLMAAPMLILYEGSILVAAAFGRKKSPPTPEPQEEDNG
jgi:sec-independent protein translocase protein TatC